MDGDYRIRVDAVRKCAVAAYNYGYPYFAVQDGGQCLSGPDAETTYAIHGRASYCPSDGKGGAWVNQVYSITFRKYPSI